MRAFSLSLCLSLSNLLFCWHFDCAFAERALQHFEYLQIFVRILSKVFCKFSKLIEFPQQVAEAAESEERDK